MALVELEMLSINFKFDLSAEAVAAHVSPMMLNRPAQWRAIFGVPAGAPGWALASPRGFHRA